MRASRGEIKIEEILKENDISFVQEYTFPDLTSFSGHPLRFDFAVFDDARLFGIDKSLKICAAAGNHYGDSCFF